MLAIIAQVDIGSLRQSRGAPPSRRHRAV